MPLLTALLDQFRQSRARTAIEVAGDVWTYGRLDEASSRIAGSLAGSDAPVDRPVAVLAEHGPGLIAAIVGVVRSGRCYLALNPSHSPDRLRAICEEIQPARLIVSAGCRELH